VLASALRSGLTDRRAKQLTEWLRVPRATIERWRAWWLQGFVESSFWKVARAQFMPMQFRSAPLWGVGQRAIGVALRNAVGQCTA